MQLDQRTPFDELEARGKRLNSTVPFHVSSEDSEQVGGVGPGTNGSCSLVVGETLNVLVVDDDAIELRVLAKNLTAGGHTVGCAGNGQEALKQTLEDPPQLIITDLVMPELDGISFCKLLRQSKRGRQIYVLILTSCEDEERVVEAFDAGADDYLV